MVSKLITMKAVSIYFIILLTALNCYSQNQPPVGVPDTISVMEQAQAYTFIDVKANDYDPDGEEFWITDYGLYNANGSNLLYLINDSLFLWFNNIDDLPKGWYRIRDAGNAVSERIHFVINPLPNPDVPVAVNDTIQLMSLVPHTIDVMANDYDPNGDEIIINHVSGEVNCVVTINSDSLSLTIIPGLASTYSFRYRVREYNISTYNNFSKYAGVTGSTLPNPDMPLINPDNATATGGIETMIDVLANDSDPQGEAIEIATFTQPSKGNLNKVNNKFYYTPQLSYKGADSFTYNIREVADNSIYTHKATVTIDVLKNPDCPVGVADYASGMTGVEMIIDVLANDFDPNGDAIKIKEVEGGTITADQKIKYKSSIFQLNSATIKYRIEEVNNPNSYSEWTPVNITLAVNPDLPVAVTDTLRVRGGIRTSLLPLKNDILNNADTLILSSAQSGRLGYSLVVRDTLKFIPAYQANGTERLKYFVKGLNNTPLAIGEIVVIAESKFYDSLQISNINAGVHGGSFLFSNHSEVPGYGLSTIGDFTPHFKFPKGTEKTTIFNSSFWAGGLDEQNNLYFAGERYKQGPGASGGADFKPGPIANHYDTEYLMKYLRVWKVSREEVAYHINNYWKPDYIAPEAIANWPAHGKVSNGEAPNLAPYYDANADGEYNCTQGDYPLIRGDQSIFLMFNDDTEHTESLGNPLKLEVHAMVYGFSNPDDTAVYNSVFVHYDLINRSNRTYHDFYTAIFTDIDLGFAEDDYIGSNVTYGSFYGYNGKPVDGEGQYWAYGENPPVQSITILAGPLKDEDGIDNPAANCSQSINGLNFGNGIIDDERLGMSNFMYPLYLSSGVPTYWDDPIYAEEFYNNMRGYWRDGTQMQYGGKGHPTMGSVGPACNYMFPGDSDPFNWGTSCVQPNGGYNQNGKFWTEVQAQNKEGDRRGVGSVGPFTFRPNQVHELDVAFSVTEATPGVMGSALENLPKTLYDLRQRVLAGGLVIPNSSLGFNKQTQDEQNIRLYPNPAHSYITCEITGSSNTTPSQYTIYNLIGNEVAGGIITDYPRQTINIANLKPGVYLIKFQLNDKSKVMKIVKR